MTRKNQDDPAELRAPRRPYEAPAVIESAAFETLALACAATPPEALCKRPFGTPRFS